MRLKGAILDLDGTLLDSMGLWEKLGYQYLTTRGIKAPEDTWEAIKPLSLLQAAEYFKVTYGLPETPQVIMDQLNAMIIDQYQHHIQLKPYAHKFLELLKAASVCTCIATATDRFLVVAALNRLGIASYIDFITTCGEVGHGKDEPHIYLQALTEMGTALSETVVFEDALYAIKTAKAAGFTVMGVCDPTSAGDEAAIRSIADGYITSYQSWEVST